MDTFKLNKKNKRDNAILKEKKSDLQEIEDKFPYKSIKNQIIDNFKENRGDHESLEDNLKKLYIKYQKNLGFSTEAFEAIVIIFDFCDFTETKLEISELLQKIWKNVQRDEHEKEPNPSKSYKDIEYHIFYKYIDPLFTSHWIKDIIEIDSMIHLNLGKIIDFYHKNKISYLIKNIGDGYLLVFPTERYYCSEKNYDSDNTEDNKSCTNTIGSLFKKENGIAVEEYIFTGCNNILKQHFTKYIKYKDIEDSKSRKFYKDPEDTEFIKHYRELNCSIVKGRGCYHLIGDASKENMKNNALKKYIHNTNDFVGPLMDFAFRINKLSHGLLIACNDIFHEALKAIYSKKNNSEFQDYFIKKPCYIHRGYFKGINPKISTETPEEDKDYFKLWIHIIPEARDIMVKKYRRWAFGSKIISIKAEILLLKEFLDKKKKESKNVVSLLE